MRGKRNRGSSILYARGAVLCAGFGFGTAQPVLDRCVCCSVFRCILVRLRFDICRPLFRRVHPANGSISLDPPVSTAWQRGVSLPSDRDCSYGFCLSHHLVYPPSTFDWPFSRSICRQQSIFRSPIRIPFVCIYLGVGLFRARCLKRSSGVLEGSCR